MIKFHAIVINFCVIEKFSFCDKTTLPFDRNDLKVTIIVFSYLKKTKFIVSSSPNYVSIDGFSTKASSNKT